MELNDLIQSARQKTGTDNGPGAARTKVGEQYFRAGVEWGGGYTLRVTERIGENFKSTQYTSGPGGGWVAQSYEKTPDGFERRNGWVPNAMELESLVSKLEPANWQEEIWQEEKQSYLGFENEPRASGV